VSSGAGNAGAVMSALDAAAAQARAQMSEIAAPDMKFCAIDDPTCEACQ
jgi:ribonucleoside-diphosphate reductase alpha chain